jgi:hypothetical protein
MAEPAERGCPDGREGDALRAAGIAGQGAQFLQLGDGSLRIHVEIIVATAAKAS